MKPSPNYTAFNQSGLPHLGPVQIRKILPFYNNIVASWSNPTENACGSAAIATLMVYWGKVTPGPNLTDTVKSIYSSADGAPDILGGIFGTSIERIRDYQIRRGLQATGYNIERKTVSSIDGKFEWLRGWVDAGYPAAVIMDTGPLGSPHGAHWAVVVKMDSVNKRIEAANFVPGDSINGAPVNSQGMVSLDPNAFMKAWEADIIKIVTIHFASVISHT